MSAYASRKHKKYVHTCIIIKIATYVANALFVQNIKIGIKIAAAYFYSEGKNNKYSKEVNKWMLSS